MSEQPVTGRLSGLSDLQKMLTIHTSKAYDRMRLDSPFVSTTRLENTAIDFAGTGGHVIEIWLPKQLVVDGDINLGPIREGVAFDVHAILGRDPGGESEFAILHEIPNEYIVRFGQVTSDPVPMEGGGWTYKKTVERWLPYPDPSPP